MFLGSYEPSFNLNSRRVALPKKIRDALTTKEFILSFGFEKSIFGFDSQDWEKESARRIREPLTTRSARDLRRFFFSSAELVKLDYQGRFVIPIGHFKWAQIKKPIIIGTGDHFEIWDQVNWQKHQVKLQRLIR